MKATGIVRRIDELGRIVIPKEIRRRYRIKEGDSLEIFISDNGEIILKKYSPFEELSDFAKLYCESIWQNTGNIIAMSDTERYIACSGKKEIIGKNIEPDLENILKEREKLIASKTDASYCHIIPNDEEVLYEAVIPIISLGDVVGSIIMLCTDKGVKFGEMESKIISVAAVFLGKQLEA